MRTHFTQEAKPYLHGEIVAIGDCLQLAFNGHPEQVAPFRDFMRSMNMPLTLEDIIVSVERRPLDENAII